MNIDIFEFSPTKLAESYTTVSHRTIYHLCEKGIITEEQCNELVSTIMVSAVPNRKGFGEKLLTRLFNKPKDNSDTWVFPIVELPKDDGIGN